tara:strand:- start:1640 stop:1870 length:231 start_codon:yes stop_codon:yes gene_type:complete
LFCYESRSDGNPFNTGFKGLTAKFFRFIAFKSVSVHFISRTQAERFIMGYLVSRHLLLECEIRVLLLMGCGVSRNQ